MNRLYYNKIFQSEANAWWRGLSINEMKAFEKQFKTILGHAIPSEIAEIYHKTQLANCDGIETDEKYANGWRS